MDKKFLLLATILLLAELYSIWLLDDYFPIPMKNLRFVYGHFMYSYLLSINSFFVFITLEIVLFNQFDVSSTFNIAKLWKYLFLVYLNIQIRTLRIKWCFMIKILLSFLYIILRNYCNSLYLMWIYYTCCDLLYLTR